LVPVVVNDVVLDGSGLLRLDSKSSADPSEAKTEPINRHDWDDPHPHHEQGALDGLTVVRLKSPCK
jgi:hypothetical protein